MCVAACSTSNINPNKLYAVSCVSVRLLSFLALDVHSQQMLDRYCFQYSIASAARCLWVRATHPIQASTLALCGVNFLASSECGNCKLHTAGTTQYFLHLFCDDPVPTTISQSIIPLLFAVQHISTENLVKMKRLAALCEWCASNLRR